MDNVRFGSLISEMQDWSNNYSDKIFKDKVLRVYTKCIVGNKLLIADKIKEKYKNEFLQAPKSDILISYCCALLAANQKYKS